LIALAVAIAAVAFVLAKPDDEENDPQRPAAQTTTSEPAPPTATTESRPEQRIQLRDHKPVGGVRSIRAKKGDFVRLTAESDKPDELHLHGYDITRQVTPADPARFSFRAQIEGVFELEGHEAEDAGEDAVVARLVVE
jgi:FtsP/CotA-like multicopper oxidase with cupredoxin domain